MKDFDVTDWVNALRSGEYVQGEEVLRSADNKYCCLGVLCDLFAKENQGEWVLDGMGTFYSFEVIDPDAYNSKDWNHEILPLAVAKWAGITSTGELTEVVWDRPESRGVSADWLTALNDHGYTFEQIADVIESGKLKKIAT